MVGKIFATKRFLKTHFVIFKWNAHELYSLINFMIMEPFVNHGRGYIFQTILTLEMQMLITEFSAA